VIKLVTLDSVDESIYNMQQRKAKMNEAILGSAAELKKIAEEEKKIVVEEAVQKYLKSPNCKKSKNAEAVKENNENKAEGFDEEKAETSEQVMTVASDEESF
jgi:hypothetical protein